MFNSSQMASQNLSVDAVHDGIHDLGDGPLGRESFVYIIILPEEEIALFAYSWVSKDSVAGAALAVFGAGIGPEPIDQRLADRPVPPTMNLDNWAIEGYSLKHDLKFDKALVRWQTPEATVDFSYEASHPPYAYGSHPQGCPKYAAANRIEQSGRVQGTLTLGNRVISIDTTSHRDHSWGTRDWFAIQHYEWFVGQVGDEISVHFWRYEALGATLNRGFVFKNGLMAAVADVDISVEFDKDFWQQRYTAKITDDMGRITSLSTEVFGHYTLMVDPGYPLRESGGRAIIDGKQGVGWLEIAWPQSYLDHISKYGLY